MGSFPAEKKRLLDRLGFEWKTNTIEALQHPSVEFEETEIEDKDTSTSAVSSSKEEHFGAERMDNDVALRQGSSEDDVKQLPRERLSNKKMGQNQVLGQAGEMPAGEDFPHGWIMRWKKRQSGLRRGLVVDRTWTSPSGRVFRSKRTVQAFLGASELPNDERDDHPDGKPVGRSKQRGRTLLMGATRSLIQKHRLQFLSARETPDDRNDHLNCQDPVGTGGQCGTRMGSRNQGMVRTISQRRGRALLLETRALLEKR
jgi:hypothetical protein